MIMRLRLEGNSITCFRVAKNHFHIIGIGHDMQRVEKPLK